MQFILFYSDGRGWRTGEDDAESFSSQISHTTE